MQKINGKSAFTGIAIGQIKEFHKAESEIPQYRITDTREFDSCFQFKI